MDLFGTSQLHNLQLHFTNFTTEQLSLNVGKVDDSIWLLDQHQLHENKFLVGITPYTFEIMF
jgi:hypothetical protein